MQLEKPGAFRPPERLRTKTGAKSLRDPTLPVVRPPPSKPAEGNIDQPPAGPIVGTRLAMPSQIDQPPAPPGATPPSTPATGTTESEGSSRTVPSRSTPSAAKVWLATA